MRMAFLGDGSLNHVRRWVGYFKERGHEVLLLSFESVEGCPFPARRLKAHLPTKLLGYGSALGAIRKELGSFRPDIVSALYLGGYGFVAAMSGRRPLAVSSIGSDLLVDYPSSIVHKLQIRYVLKKADLVITDADELSRVAISAGAQRERILKAYMGIDDHVFFPRGVRGEMRVGGAETDGPEGAVRGGAGSEAGRSRIVSTRNLFPIYDIDALIEAAAIVRERYEAVFVICGDGPERARLEEKARGLGLERDIVFKGRLGPREIADELRAADVYVSTSKSDSTSVSLLEAMACGATPVVTDLPANREWIKDGENGLIFPLGSARGLADAVLKALGNPQFRASARERNWSVVKERGLFRDNMRRVEGAFEETTRNYKKR